MVKNIYIVRHCEATGQPAASPLTENGFAQANDLADFLQKMNIERIVSSPFLRAIQSVNPLSDLTKIKIETDVRLSERILSTTNLPDWYDKLKATFIDLDLKFKGGESSREAMDRIATVVEEVVQSELGNTVIVSHGNIISLLLKHYDAKFGFDEWKELSNPDVYQMVYNDGEINIERIWMKGSKK